MSKRAEGLYTLLIPSFSFLFSPFLLRLATHSCLLWCYGYPGAAVIAYHHMIRLLVYYKSSSTSDRFSLIIFFILSQRYINVFYFLISIKFIERSYSFSNIIMLLFQQIYNMIFTISKYMSSQIYWAYKLIYINTYLL